MLKNAPTIKDIKKWNEIYKEFKDKLVPNRKSGPELLEYLNNRYKLEEINDDYLKGVVVNNVLDNEIYSFRLNGLKPNPKVFSYRVDEDTKIIIGIELTSGVFFTEDEAIWNELCKFQGLDEFDLKNPYLVYEYVTCTKSKI